MSDVSSLLASFKTKIEEAVSLVPSMPAEEKLKAVQFWNVVSEKLQEIVNNSAADISALAFELEKESTAKMLENNLDKSELPISDASISNECPGTESQQHIVPNMDQLPNEMKLTENQIVGISEVQDSVLQDTVGPHLEHLLKGASTSDALGNTLLESEEHVAATSAFEAITSDVVSQSDIAMPALIQPSSISATPVSGAASTEVTLTNLSGPLPPNTTIMIDPGIITSSGTADGSNTTTITTIGPQTPVPKSILSRRTRGRSVKKEKNEGPDWTPLEEQGNRANRQTGSREGLRNSRSKLLQELDANEEESGGSDDEGLDSVLDDGGLVVDYEDDEEEGEEGDEGELKNGSKILIKLLSDKNADENAENKHGKIEKAEKKEQRNKRSRRRRKEGGGDGFHQTDESDYSCEFCHQTFPNLSSLRTHRWIHTKPYACTECSARFSTKGNLIVHKRRHTGEKPYGCNQCDARFSTKGNLKRHVKTHSGEKPWECVQCGGRFTEKKSLKVHMRRHTGEKPYECKVCSKRFAQTGILQTHMAMHMDQKAHLCDHCGKSFRQKSQLRLHMMRHDGVRKYQCGNCTARFLTKGDLERHNRIHTGERPFICDICGKTFTRQQSLNEHMNRHYGLKPYECKYCGKNFAEMSACYKHIKQHERSQISTMQQHQVTVDSADGQKFTVLVHTDQPLDVGSEISVVQQDQTTTIPADSHIAVAVTDQIGEFAAINLLANASSFQQTF